MSAREPSHDRYEEPDLGGDPVCWIDRVCPECGAFLTDGARSECPRCGHTPTDQESS